MKQKKNEHNGRGALVIIVWHTARDTTQRFVRSVVSSRKWARSINTAIKYALHSNETQRDETNRNLIPISDLNPGTGREMEYSYLCKAKPQARGSNMADWSGTKYKVSKSLRVI